MKLLCSIYRSPRKQGMYLYVPRAKGISEVPEPLLKLFGKPEHAMDMVLTEQRKLAREDIHQVLENLQNQGYHLQMPPQQEDWIVHLPDELLTRNDPV
ncbi:MAG: YcgL domain-containing protein [Pseudomonas sp.]